MKSWIQHGTLVTATNTRIVAILGSDSCPKALFDYCLREAKMLETLFVPQDEFYLDTRAIYFDHNEHYLTHLINTPSHSDFIGEVTAALRIADGAIVVVDCELGVTQHTISLVRRAIEEHVRLVLLLDKVESLCTNSPEEASEMLDLMLWKLNSQVPIVLNEFSLINDNIVFGSLEHGWIVSYEQLSSAFSEAPVSSSNSAPSTTFMRSLDELIKRSELKDSSTSGPSSSINNEKMAIERFHRAMRELCADKALYEMTVKRLPSPIEAQKYRAAYWYSGSHTDEVLEAVSKCDSNGPTMVLISKIVWGKFSSISNKMAPFAVGRVCSGSIRPNQQLYHIVSSRNKPPEVVSLINVYAITNIAEELEECASGNIVLIPWPDKILITTLSSLTTASNFTAIYPRPNSPTCLEYFIEPGNESLLNALKSVLNCDHAGTVSTNEWYGFGFGAVGTKHAEVLLKRLKDFVEVDLVIHGPHFKYRESITAPSSMSCLSKSPNKINRVWTRARLMDSTLKRILSSQNLPFDEIQKNIEILNAEYLFVDETYVSLPGLIEPNVVFIDKTLMKSLSSQGTIDWLDSLRAGSLIPMQEGVLCNEPLIGVHFAIEDVLIAADNRRRGAGQLIVMFRRSITAAQLTAGPVLLEAVLFVEIHVPQSVSCNDIREELARKRAVIVEEEYLKHSNITIIRCHVPVVENLEIKGVVFSCFFSHWERVPGDPLEEGSFANNVVRGIRKRKLLTE